MKRKRPEKTVFFCLAEEKKVIWAESKYTYNPQEQKQSLKAFLCAQVPAKLS